MPYPKNKPRVDLTGRRFGRLVVQGKTSGTLRGNIIWDCLCDCGNTRYVPTTSLNSGNTTSCGCLTRENQYSSVALPTGQAAFNRLYNQYKYNATHLGRVFELTKDEFKRITSSNCYYCGIEPRQTNKEPHFNGVYPYNGIDRVDPTKGYILENTVPCCKRCNRAKDDMTFDEFIKWLEKAYSYSRTKREKIK